jgi:protein tyrosine phosphatase (PTP) superfamily phosphohydrolase (DUF442 family)
VNTLLLELEKNYAIGPTFAARLLGVAYPTYAAYRSGSRALQLYHERHVQSLMMHSDAQRQQLIQEHLNASRNGR